MKRLTTGLKMSTGPERLSPALGIERLSSARRCVLSAAAKGIPIYQWACAAAVSRVYAHCSRWQSSSSQDALMATRSRALQAAQRAGFTERETRLCSGEPITFLERPPAGGERPRAVVVFLHGLTNDRIMSAQAFAKAAQHLPHARCLLPDAAGHGGRMAWALNKKNASALSPAEHVLDFSRVLDAMLMAPEIGTDEASELGPPSSEGLPVDLIGYSMGGATAFRFAAQYPQRVRNVALLAPALLLHQHLAAATAAAAASGRKSEIVYNYRTHEQALKMCALVGWPMRNAEKLAPLLVAGRQDHPHHYWADVWLAFVGAYGGGEGKGEGEGDIGQARSLQARSLQAVTQHGERLRESGRRVLVVQGTQELVVEPRMPEILQHVLGPLCERHDLVGLGHRGHPFDGKEEFLNPACNIAGEWLASKRGNATK